MEPPRHAANARLRAVPADLAEPALTESDLEERFPALCRRPRPRDRDCKAGR